MLNEELEKYVMKHQFILALHEKNFEEATRLINKGLDLNEEIIIDEHMRMDGYKYIKNSYLVYFSRNGDMDIIEFLLNAGMDLQKNKNDMLIKSIQHFKGENTTLIDFLLHNGADVNQHEGYILRCILIYSAQDHESQKDAIYIFTHLLEKGADPTLPKIEGDSLLMCAIKSMKCKFIDILLQHMIYNENIFSRSAYRIVNDEGKNVLDLYLEKYGKDERYKIIEERYNYEQKYVKSIPL